MQRGSLWEFQGHDVRSVARRHEALALKHENLNFYWKHLMFGLLLRGGYKDHLLQETLVQDSALDWTIVRPAACVDTPKDAYKHGFGAAEAGLSLTIARSDVARFMLEQLGTGNYLHKTPGLSY